MGPMLSYACYYILWNQSENASTYRLKVSFQLGVVLFLTVRLRNVSLPSFTSTYRSGILLCRIDCFHIISCARRTAIENISRGQFRLHRQAQAQRRTLKWIMGHHWHYGKSSSCSPLAVVARRRLVLLYVHDTLQTNQNKMSVILDQPQAWVCHVVAFTRLSDESRLGSSRPSRDADRRTVFKLSSSLYSI